MDRLWLFWNLDRHMGEFCLRPDNSFMLHFNLDIIEYIKFIKLLIRRLYHLIEHTLCTFFFAVIQS